MALRLEWTDQARADIRVIDRLIAMRIFEGIQRYCLTGEGDLKRLQGKYSGQLRLRIGDYRVFLEPDRGVFRILAVKSRKDAYRA